MVQFGLSPPKASSYDGSEFSTFDEKNGIKVRLGANDPDVMRAMMDPL